LESLWKDILGVLEEGRPHDILFALLYSTHDKECDSSNLSTLLEDQIASERLVLEGHVGIDGKNSDAPQLFQLMPTELHGQLHLAEPRLLQIDQNSAFRKGMQPLAHDSKHPADNVMLCPIFAHDVVRAFLLLGVDPEACDDNFKMYAQILCDCVSSHVGTFLLRKELRDAQSASDTLLQRVEEVERSNFMFRHMAESATVGCAIFDPTGRPMWLNEAYINLTGVCREDFRPGIWQKAIIPEDLPDVEGRWKKLASGESIIPFTFRVKRHHSATAKPGSCESLDYRWLLSNAFVDLNEDGSCRRIMGWLTDISAQKWNENLQAQRLADALETKRQTERFIDMVRALLSCHFLETF
jgi:PAS domain-containing protein